MCLDWFLAAPVIGAEIAFGWIVINHYEDRICTWLDDLAKRMER